MSAPTSPVAGAPEGDERTHEEKMRDVQTYVSAGGTWPPPEGGLTPDVEQVVDRRPVEEIAREIVWWDIGLQQQIVRALRDERTANQKRRDTVGPAAVSPEAKARLGTNAGHSLTPDVERVVRAAGRLSPGVWRQLGKWLRTREGTAGPWDPDDPPVLAQIANEVDEIADALAALRVAPAVSGEEKS